MSQKFKRLFELLQIVAIALMVVFGLLKITGVVDWSWLWILVPPITALVILAIAWLVPIIIMIIYLSWRRS